MIFQSNKLLLQIRCSSFCSNNKNVNFLPIHISMDVHHVNSSYLLFHFTTFVVASSLSPSYSLLMMHSTSFYPTIKLLPSIFNVLFIIKWISKVERGMKFGVVHFNIFIVCTLHLSISLPLYYNIPLSVYIFVSNLPHIVPSTVVRTLQSTGMSFIFFVFEINFYLFYWNCNDKQIA